MTDALTLKIYGVDQAEWVRCQKVARQYLIEYPDRIGIRCGCVYHVPNTDWPALYVYRTKTMIVVRGI